ncbi:hypothetical protein H2200_000044 [Cladophialophora chaetospira]|uniref:Anaphase-promoting complex subunit 4 n=1 Tax=Cladophialophora chaetospira TaxID=386627 RepID=A0AA38XNJ7_9EURO|nr:hypothetical protein H2200_000044 [Cladophialophora chaetospira]
MDLVATVTKTDSVDVWRLNGQRVFGASFAKEEDEDGEEGAPPGAGGSHEDNVKGLAWRRDGQILAVACSDGSLSLMNAFTGKIAHRISTHSTRHPSSTPSSQESQQQSQSRRRSSKVPSQPLLPPLISTVSWTTHFAYPSPDTIRTQFSSSESPSIASLDQLLSLRADVDKILQLKADLPRELSNIDIEASLPKLSTLPPTGVGVDDDVFSSRGSVDVIFHDGGSTSGSGVPSIGGVDALLVGLSDRATRCEVHLRIFDSFEVGTVDISAVMPTREPARVIRIQSHPYLATVFLVVEQSSERDKERRLHLLSLDLSFIPQTGRNLPLVAKKATQLGNLLRYISQVQTQLVAEVKAAFDLPSRFLRNINESLVEADENADFVYAAHHLAVTGDCDPKLKEWLVDEVGDRGLKRWEKAVGDCLEVVRRMTSECLLPALERCLVVLSRLDGLARFGPTSTKLGLDEKGIRKVRETADAMGLLTEDLLLDVGIEMREFASFIKWLKWECEVEALEEGSERAEELRESWTGEAELKTVLEYVDGALKESRLKKYLVREGKEEDTGAFSFTSFDGDPDIGFYAEYTKRRASGAKDKKMPTLGHLIERLQKQSEAVFAQIAETFRKSILATYLTELPLQCDCDKLDLRIIPDETDRDLYRLVAISPDRGEKDQLRQVVITLRQGATKGLEHTMTTHNLVVPEATRILDAKFVDDNDILVLAETSSDVKIYARNNILDEGEDVLDLRHTFEQGQMNGLRPARLDVNGRIGRRALVVLDSSGLGYTVFDLDADDGQGREDGGSDSFMTG